MSSITTEYKGKRRVKDLDSGEIFEIDYIKKTTDRHLSYQTTFETFKKLSEKGLIRKFGTAWVVMPSFVSTFGSDAKNARLLTEYSEAEESSLFDDEIDEDIESA